MQIKLKHGLGAFYAIWSASYLLCCGSWQMQQLSAVSAHDDWQCWQLTACTCVLASGLVVRKSTNTQNQFITITMPAENHL